MVGRGRGRVTAMAVGWAMVASLMCSTTGSRGSPVGVGRRFNDFDGDGRSALAVWEAVTGTWTIRQSTTATTLTPQWGASEASEGIAMTLPRPAATFSAVSSANSRCS